MNKPTKRDRLLKDINHKITKKTEIPLTQTVCSKNAFIIFPYWSARLNCPLRGKSLNDDKLLNIITGGIQFSDAQMNSKPVV